MHPAQIQAALKMRGVTQTAVAEQCGGVSSTAVYQVIQGNSRSRKIEMRIAAITGISLGDLWPQWHGTKAQRTRRAPMSHAQVADALRAVAG